MTDRRSETPVQARPAPLPTPDSFFDFGSVPSNDPMRGPEDMPHTGFLEAATNSFWSDATADSGRAARIKDATDAGYSGVVTELQRRGIAGQFTHRYARDAWALSYDEGAIWRAVTAARAADPKAFADLPKSADEYRRQLEAPVQAAIDRERNLAARGPIGSGIAGSLAYGLTDPINTPLMVAAAAPAKTIAQAVVRDALLNAQIAAVEQPVTAIERAQHGEALGAGEAAANVAVAGVTGAVFGGLVKGAEIGAGRLRDMIGWGRMTDDERAATHVLERDAEIDATNPYRTGPDAEAHQERLALAMRDIAEAVQGDAPAPAGARASLLAGTALGSAAPPVAPEAPRGAFMAAAAERDTFKRRVAAAESGGNDAAASATSSAFGRYQFTQATWERYRQRFAPNRTPEQWAAMRGDPAMQESVMDALTDANARALARIGEPETAGNLYLMHFLGEGGATHILKAAPDTPVSRVLRAEVIEANPFLRTMTADDLMRWAYGRMGEDMHGGPVVRRDLFPGDEAGDAEWRAAQAEAAAAEAEISARRARGEIGDGEPSVALGRDLVPEAQPAAERLPEPVGTDWQPEAETGQRSVGAATDSNIVGKLPDRGVAPAFLGNDDRIYVGAVGSNHISAVSQELRSVGLKGTGFATPEGKFLNRAEALDYVNSHGENIRPSENMEGELDALDYSEQSKFVPPNDYGRRRQAWEQDNPWWTGERLFQTSASPEAHSGVERVSYESQSAARKEIAETTAARADNRPLPTAMAAAGDAAVRDPEVTAAADVGRQFDDPASAAADAQAMGLGHDVRQALDAGDLGAVPFAVDGIAGSLGDMTPRYEGAASVLARLDADDAAIAALRACL